MNDAISATFEDSQQGRKHGGGLRLGVMEEHDAATRCLDSLKDEAQLLCRRHRYPVARPHVGTEYYYPPAFEPRQQGGRGGKTREAKERRRRRSVALAVERGIDSRKSTLDF